MTAEGCRNRREALGLYVLGQLAEPEREALEAHIEGCPGCRAEVASLEPVARLLPLADPERLDKVPAPPPDLGGRIAASIAAERRAQRRSHRLRFGLAFGGVAAAAAAALAIFVLPGRGGGEPSQRVVFESVPPGVAISASLQPKPFGTEIRMEVSGIRSGTLCRVFFRRNDGARVPVGTFRYRYGGDSDAVLSSALDLSRASAVGVRAGDRTFIQPVKSQPLTEEST
jgi:hypothetical protein